MKCNKRLIAFCTLFLFLICFSGCALQTETQSDVSHDSGILSVYVQDVGNADSIFILLPDGKSMLIDGGEAESAEQVLSLIQSTGTNKIDYLVATHPHKDHIGGLPFILQNMEVGEVYMPNAVHTTKTFERFLNAIEERNVPVHQAKAGVSLCAGEGYSAKFLAPVQESYEDLNNYSAVVRLEYGEKVFLFMGDAEKQVEEELAELCAADLQADVLKVGHHGSNTSSKKAFLECVMPEIAVISADKENDYGHPSEKVLQRLSDVGANILRTDISGTVVLKTDGAEWKETGK